MNATETIQWLNTHDPFNVWAVDDDVYCLHCDGVFKAQDMARDRMDTPTCPVCQTSSLMDFAMIPWWREDLIQVHHWRNYQVFKWLGKPIWAVAGSPGRLPQLAE